MFKSASKLLTALNIAARIKVIKKTLMGQLNFFINPPYKVLLQIIHKWYIANQFYGLGRVEFL